MKKRLRKKKRVGEFQELGFRIGFRFSENLDEKTKDDITDRFIEEAIENNCLQFGGGGNNEWSGFITSDRSRVSTSDLHRQAVEYWIRHEPLIVEYFVSPLVDAWHGDFDDDSEIEWKIK